MTEKVGIIGWPIEHSLSPVMHNAAFAALGLDWHYEAMAIPPDIVQYGLKEPMRHNFIGINVTIPFKQEVMRMVTPDEIARAVGAVNTIDFRDSTGTNTDVAGLIEDLQAHDMRLQASNVLVLGAGGAARAAVYGLATEGAHVTVVNRTLEKAKVMVADLSISAGGTVMSQVSVKTLDEAAEMPVDLIVNCTPVGMWPNTHASPWVEGVPFPQGVTVYDMIYRPAQTQLMQLAEANGGRSIGGLGMLVRQGAHAFKKWTGVDPPIDVMFAAVREELAKRENKPQ